MDGKNSGWLCVASLREALFKQWAEGCERGAWSKGEKRSEIGFS